jgi:hypothetical protein
MNALQLCPVPSNRSELRILLGTFGYWRPYMRSYARIVAPLTGFTSEKRDWEWNDTHSTALLELNHALHCSPVLLRPDQDEPFMIRYQRTSQSSCRADCRTRRKAAPPLCEMVS